MSIRSPRLVDPSVRLPADLPAIDEVGLRRPPQAPPEELRVGGIVGPRLGRSGSQPDARAVYPLSLPLPPPAPPGALAHLRNAAERLAISSVADLAALRVAEPALAAALDPLLASEQALGERLVRIVALREMVDAMRRVALGEPR